MPIWVASCLWQGAQRPSLPLPLEGDALGVDAAQDEHVPVQSTDLLDIEIGDEAVQAGVGDVGAVGRQDALGELQVLCDVGDRRDLR